MVSPSTAPIMLNHSRLSDEIFSANVAALRENLDHMFVLLMGAITCFLQVFTFFIFWKNIHKSIIIVLKFVVIVALNANKCVKRETHQYCKKYV